jgi:hypothetical protein
MEDRQQAEGEVEACDRTRRQRGGRGEGGAASTSALLPRRSVGMGRIGGPAGADLVVVIPASA